MSPFAIESVHRVGVVGRYNTPDIARPLKRLAGFLAGRGLRVCMETETAAMAKISGVDTAGLAVLGESVDLMIVIGGDGTMLTVARVLAPTHIPLIGINQGRLGFLTDIALADMEVALGAMLDGDATLEERIMLSARVLRGGQRLFQSLAFNDVVVNRGASGGMIDLSVSIGDSYVCDLRADGVIVANGPIVHPSLRAWALVPISPHALTNRPLVIGDDAQVTITITGARDAAIHCDGHHHHELEDGDQVVVESAPFSIRLLHPRGYDYFAMLRQKLHWSASPLGESRTRAPAPRAKRVAAAATRRRPPRTA
jgi:NAD+ kinase